MPSTGGKYAVKKRRRPARKSPESQPPEGAKSNPSKRHRDRLNQELSKLTNLLPFPEDVRVRLDKLSILRLIMGYLKAKSYFAATLKDSKADCSADPPMNPGGIEHTSPQVNVELFSEGDLLLQTLDGFLMAVTEDGYVLYVSPTVQDYLGFHQSDVIYQSVFELIHKEDRAMFQSQLCWPSDTAPVGREEEQDTHSLRGEKFLPLSDTSTDSLQHQPLEDPSYLERSFVCRFRCLLDNSSGFLELNFHGHLKFLPGQNNRSEDGILVYPQLTLFATATPRQPVTILELQNKTFLFQTKHKLDFTPIACDSRGKAVLGYTESELCRRGSGYQFIHTADMRNAEGEEHLHKRALQLPFTFTTGEAVLYESSPVGPLTPLPARRRTRARKGSPTRQGPAHWRSLLGTMIQDESMHLSHITPTRRDSPLERGVSHDRHEEKEEEEQGEDSSFLALIETLLEKDTEEQPDLCSTLQPLWRENLLRADLDSAGPQNCCLLPPSQGRAPHSTKEALFHDGGSVGLPSRASTTALQTLRPQSSLGPAQPGREVAPPQDVNTAPSCLQAQPQHLPISGPSLQSPPQRQLQHSHAAPVDLRICQKPATFDLSPLPKASSPSQPAQAFPPTHTPPLSLGENVPGHLAQPGPGVLDLCKESMPWTLTHSGQCQGPLITSDPTSCVNPCATHPLVSIWDSPIQGQPVVVPMEVGAGQGAGQAQPDSFSHTCSAVADPRLSWEGPASDLPPNLCRGLPPSVQGAPGIPEDTLGSQEHPPRSLRGSQLMGSPTCPCQVLLQEPLAIQGSRGADPGPATKQQWVQMGLQTQENYSWVRGRVPNAQHPGGCLRDIIPQAPQLGPLPAPDSKGNSPGTGGSHGNSSAEPTRQSKDRLAIPAPGAVSRPRGQPSPILPCCPPDPPWPPASTQGSHDLQLQVGVGNWGHSHLGAAGRGAPPHRSSAELPANLDVMGPQPSRPA